MRLPAPFPYSSGENRLTIKGVRSGMNESTDFRGPVNNPGEKHVPRMKQDFKATAKKEAISGECCGESASNLCSRCAEKKANRGALQTKHQPLHVERRQRRRALISAPVRVRGLHVTGEGPDEVSTTVDVSRSGLLFITPSDSYYRGQEVAVTFPFSRTPEVVHAEQRGRVARVHTLPDGRREVAIAIGAGAGEDLVDASGRKLKDQAIQLTYGLERPTDPQKPLVLAVDGELATRESIKNYLQNEGYEVIVVSTCSEAREVLNVSTPAILIAEVEGEDFPGFDLCAFVKSSPRLRAVPVVLTTRSGNPTDYSNAHSLGAVVCMAKPYKQDRLGHITRLLAPLPHHHNKPAPRPADPSRRPGGGGNSKGNGSSNGNGFLGIRLRSFR
jgi:CheY-like chemotaxis protein